MTDVKPESAGPLAAHIKSYLAHKRGLGNHFVSGEKTLRLLERYFLDHPLDDVSSISPPILDAFLASRPRRTSRSYNQLLGHVDCFFKWLVLHEVLASSPVRAVRRRKGAMRRPFLFDRDQGRRLIDATAGLLDTSRDEGRSRIYRMLFVLLYGLGLRVGETCLLRVQDVDLDRQVLFIHKAKLGKERWVPFGPKIANELRMFIQWRAAGSIKLQSESPLFTFDRNGCRSLRPGSVSRTFHDDLVPQLALTVPADTRPPHLHCLRHSFAVSTLLHLYQGGADPNSHLLHLATFLGHVSPSSTSVYLTITDELLNAANQRFARFAAPILKEIKL